MLPRRERGPPSFDRIQPGDLGFFDAEADTAGQFDHVEMLLGTGYCRKAPFHFRKSANGPILDDIAARSVLDRAGYYPKTLPGIPRL
ncbi:hypothetical protein GCM10007175_02610 [Pseudarthrobacter scleromae]|uniref:Uncharacterized protein n=1 Tax=Pseudarthrobacter scleromae TaxID=158897 RepID=A0ABQ2CC22_9MICC|nr:hypothetical protein GCM10007175_02610 [Pseudarthrobacter scleromae]